MSATVLAVDSNCQVVQKHVELYHSHPQRAECTIIEGSLPKVIIHYSTQVLNLADNYKCKWILSDAYIKCVNCLLWIMQIGFTGFLKVKILKINKEMRYF